MRFSSVELLGTASKYDKESTYSLFSFNSIRGALHRIDALNTVTTWIRIRDFPIGRLIYFSSLNPLSYSHLGNVWKLR